MDDLFDSPNSEEAWENRIKKASRGSERAAGRQQEPPRRVVLNDPVAETRPLAERLRPQSLDEYVGQEALLGENGTLRGLLKGGALPSMILWGPPGSGKTTLARLLSQAVNADFFTLSGVSASVRDIRSVADAAKANRKFQRRTILFIDEIHRFNKAQQDGFLPHVESGIITMIGATTENPSFSVITPLLSRCRVFVLSALRAEDLAALLQRGLARLNQEYGLALTLTPEASGTAISLSDGDARRALGLLESAFHLQRTRDLQHPIDRDVIASVTQRHFAYDKSGEEHFNLISALHKTMRSSDPHAAAYWAGRMLTSGEDPLYLLRRMVRFASEDVGLADPFAIVHANECLRAYQLLGSPEGDLAIIQLAIYLAMAPKSNAVYTAHKRVMTAIDKTGSLAVPHQLRNAPTELMKDLGYAKDYSYDQDSPDGFSPKQGLPTELAGERFYNPTERGQEKDIRARLEILDQARDDASKKNP